MSAGRARTSLGDRAMHAGFVVQNWLRFARMGLKMGPFGISRQFERYPWLGSLAKANDLLTLWLGGRTGPYREANAVLVREMMATSAEMIEGLFDGKRATVLHEDLVPPEILLAMGLHPWMGEFLGMLVPLIDQKGVEHYIDVAENEGIPPDVCSLPKSTMGVTLSGHMPKPVAIVASNMPCDGGMASYQIIQRELGAPAFRLDVPYRFYDERAIDYFVAELGRMIAWLEEKTPGRMDWDRLKEICEERNRMVELELELWDLIRAKPAPMAGEPVTIGHLLYTQACPGSPRGTRLFRRLVDLAKKTRANGGSALEDERYRVVLWNPPTLICPDLFVWAERAYGVALIMDMLAYNRHPFIDTRTPESILRGLAHVVMEGPMARHTRGPSENFFGDLFQLYERFGLDMIWMAAHIGCKNTQALLGIFREKCRERGIPLLLIDYDLSDTRIVSPDNMKRQVEQFMETVMKAERLDT